MSMNPITRLGKIMTIIGTLFFLGVLSLWFTNIQNERRDPNHSASASADAQGFEIELRPDRQGHYRLPGRINGVAVHLLVDTGATEVVIPAHLANELQLKFGSAKRAKTAGGWIEVYATNIDSLDLAGIPLTAVSASLNPAMTGHEILLGMTALTQLELSFAQDRLTLRYRP
jgi:aspartyl protease family protein